MATISERLTEALADRYHIERELGAGGMATVYLAEDLKHKRRVALKVLKPELAAVLGADRFVQEITTTAALQHPHILPLYDSGTADGFLFYVMPFIDGETLRAKLDRETQLGIDESIRIATNVADALDYAHRHGVIHRDIKPENILLHEGRPMVADFGIALAVSAAAGGRMTETGLSLGTPHYMSPEQATAEKEISARSDVYSLASVLYEMLTGNPPHTGASAQQIIMKIITEHPADVTSLRKSVPSNVAAAIDQALEKLPADRFENAKMFAQALSDARFTRAGVAGASAAKDGPWKNRFYAATLVAVVLAGVAGMSKVSGPDAISNTPSMHVRLPLQPGDSLAVPDFDVRRNGDRPSRTAFAFTPDGQSLVYAGERGGKQMLFLRPLAGETATPIAGTEGGESPFFSPNGLSLGFWADGHLRRVSLGGGPPTDIAEIERIMGGSWSDDDRIVVGVHRIGVIVFTVSNSAPPDTVVRGNARLPQWLPGGDAILFTREGKIEALTLSSGELTILIDSAHDARYVPTGHILFGRDGTMMALSFDTRRLEVNGAPVVVLDDVMQSSNGSNVNVHTGAMQMAISPQGQMAWVHGGITPDRVSTIGWLDRQGNKTLIPFVGAGAFFSVRLSPDESRFATFAFGDPTRLLVVDLASRSFQTLPGPRGPFFLWAQDGLRLVHQATVRDSAVLVWTTADNSRPHEQISDKRLIGTPAFWSPDGLELFTQNVGLLRGHLVANGATRDIAGLPEDFDWPTLSPDGKWLAYGADEPGSSGSDVFVQPWPALDRKWKISSGGGSAPAWTRGGSELVYTNPVVGDSVVGTVRVMSVDIGAGPEFTHSVPRELFTGVLPVTTPMRGWDITKDGSRFLVAVGPIPMSPPGDIHMMVNWFPHLQRLMGAEGARSGK